MSILDIFRRDATQEAERPPRLATSPSGFDLTEPSSEERRRLDQALTAATTYIGELLDAA